jgi:DNA polymerase (family 10)
MSREKTKHPFIAANILAEGILDTLKPFAQTSKAGDLLLQAAGSLRRKRPSVKDLDLVLAPLDMSRFLSVAEDTGARIENHRVTWDFELPTGDIKVEVFLSEAKHFWAQLLMRTGPYDFNISMRARAKKMGYKLNRYGLWVRDTDRVAAFDSELKYFKALDLPWLEPEERDV